MNWSFCGLAACRSALQDGAAAQQQSDKSQGAKCDRDAGCDTSSPNARIRIGRRGLALVALFCQTTPLSAISALVPLPRWSDLG